MKQITVDPSISYFSHNQESLVKRITSTAYFHLLSIILCLGKCYIITNHLSGVFTFNRERQTPGVMVETIYSEVEAQEYSKEEYIKRTEFEGSVFTLVYLKSQSDFLRQGQPPMLGLLHKEVHFLMISVANLYPR